MKFIGLTGLAGAGKDTFALALQRSLVARGVATEITSWAKPIRVIAAALGFRPYDREAKEISVAFSLDLFSDRLQQELDYTFKGQLSEHRRAELYAFTMDALDQYVYEEILYVSPRQFMQILGTEGGRRVDPNLWVNRAKKPYDIKDCVVLVPDTRFDNEVESVDLIVNVTRPGINPVNAHSSERLASQLAQMPYHTLHNVPVRNVLNDRTIDHLIDAADDIAAEIEHRRAIKHF